MKLFGKISYTEIEKGDRELNLQKEEEEDIYYNFACFVEAVEASEKENEAVEVHIPRHRDCKTKKPRHRGSKTTKLLHRDSET